MMIDNFHFLRPYWLAALLPAALVWWWMLRRGDSRQAWKQFVDPVLLDALLAGGGNRQRWRPVHLLGVFWLVGILALAGPAWRREASPFAEDEAALVIAIKVAPSMQSTDIAPSRQARAAQKVSDLLAARPGTRNSLIAYAGSAHLVMPLTTDAAVINTFAADLTPDLMPQTGDNAVAALELAQRQLASKSQPGAILFVTDGFSEGMSSALVEHRRQGGVPVHVWAATAGPPTTLRDAANAGGGSFMVIAPDTSDVEKLARHVQQTATAAVGGTGERWRDSGYWLLAVPGVIGALWFRKGWVVG